MKKILNIIVCALFMVFGTVTFSFAATANVEIDSQNNQIWGRDWPAGANVTLTIEDPDTPASPDHIDFQTALTGDIWAAYNIHFNMNLVVPFPFQLEPGQVVTLSDGTTTKTHTITNLVVTSSDADTDIVSGTAAPGSIVQVTHWAGDCPSGATRWEPADGEGNWAANFAVTGDEPGENICDITPGTPIWVFLMDADGDSTAIFWPTCNPRFNVEFSNNQIFSYEWAEDATITLTVDDPLTQDNPDYEDSISVDVDSDPNNWGHCGKTSAFFDLGDAFVMQPGHMVTVTDGAALKNHIVEDVVVTGIDVPGSTVSGTAEPFAALRVNVWNITTPHDSLNVTADGAGNWEADFSSIRPFTEATHGAVFQCDVDDDCTVVQWSLPSRITADPQNNQIWGVEWPAGDTVTLTVEDPDTLVSPDHTDSQIASAGDIWAFNNVHFNLNLVPPFQLEPDQIVTLQSGAITKTLTVTHLTVASSDADTDTVTGTAFPNSIVQVSQWSADCPGGATRWETADESGNWAANFGVTGDEPGENICDITPGTPIWVSQTDDGGDATAIFWSTCNPRFDVQVSMNQVWGYEWAEDTIVGLTVDDPDTPDNPGSIYMPVDVNDDPNSWEHCGKTSAFFDLGDAFTMKPGHTVTVTAISEGDTVKDHIVKNVVVTNIDIPNSAVSGTAEPFAALRVNVWNITTPHDSLNVTADGEGNWEADFSSIRQFTEATHGAVFQCDVDDDCTVVQWNAEATNDSDGDGLSDDDEIYLHGTDPNSPDTDGDGLSDGDEILYGTNPNNNDTDGDKMSDGWEVYRGTNPNNITESPEIPIDFAIMRVRQHNETELDLDTYIEVIIQNWELELVGWFQPFTGTIPDDIDSITIVGATSGEIAKYNYPIEDSDWEYYPQWKDFFISLDGSPNIDTYTATITTFGGLTGTSTDTQTINRTLPLFDTTLLSPASGGILDPNNLQFYLPPLSPGPSIPLYYRLEINYPSGGRIYADGFPLTQDNNRTLPDEFLPEGYYRWRPRAYDNPDWKPSDNRVNGPWTYFWVGDDDDTDKVVDFIDNCPGINNPNQDDSDNDEVGDVCDICPNDPNNDEDGDGICGDVDNCPGINNPNQDDADNDEIGDACDICPNDPNNDVDGDGLCGDVDNCPGINNPNQDDADNDEIGDACDICPNDPNNDVDGDGLCGDVDNCPEMANPDQSDLDGDELGDVCDEYAMGEYEEDKPEPVANLDPPENPSGYEEGEPIILRSTVTFKPINGEPTDYVRPDPYNVIPRLEDCEGNEIIPDQILCGPPCSLPGDLSTVTQEESFTTEIELTQWFTNLKAGCYTVTVDYVNFCKDLDPVPDYDKIWLGQETFDSQSFTVGDQCSDLEGDAGGTGCPLAVKNTVMLHTVILGKGASTKDPVPAGSATVRVFDRNSPAFQDVAGSKNPKGALYGKIFEADQGRVGTCVTDSEGICFAGETQLRDYLVILRFIDLDPQGDQTISPKTVYVGRPLSPDDFDEDGIGEKKFQIIKVFKNVVFYEYRGGSKIKW